MSGSGQGRTPAQLRVLLADDNLGDRLLAEEAFAALAQPVDLQFAENGRQALERLRDDRDWQPDVVVLDINMPIMNGFEALQSIRRDPALSLYPVVMLSSSRDPEDIVTAYDLLASSYLTKEQDFPRFMDQIESFVAFWSTCRFSPGRGAHT
ncbi:response regulator [Deinococcus radiotolerans]|uniref:response regulator n=1 Tax=Deinococcus radiotolerans TaxID=1309407 RepID=UPI001E5B98FF|nr:response regulator [Deinococcus radiotolerans]